MDGVVLSNISGVGVGGGSVGLAFGVWAYGGGGGGGAVVGQEVGQAGFEGFFVCSGAAGRGWGLAVGAVGEPVEVWG